MGNQSLSIRTRPFLALYVVWHPDFQAGGKIAETLHEHFRRQVFSNVAGGTGLSVMFRSTPVFENAPPLPIDLDSAQANAIVVLCEDSIGKDQVWIDYIKDLSEQTEKVGLSARLFPVSIDSSGLSLGLEEQALRWDKWAGEEGELTTRLIYELAYEFCRMLRHYLEHLRHPAEEYQDLEKYLQKVQIFLSHSKHDTDGERIANKIRDELHAGHGLASFFDVHDIPAGIKFHSVLLKQVSQSAVVAIHTDSYSSREWCRREIIEAKRHNVPLVVANCISDRDERGFPYLGNVPIVRMNPSRHDRIGSIIGRLLDEVLKDFLWKCRTMLAGVIRPEIVFLPRPPELISLASIPKEEHIPAPVIVYPDPPLSAEEQRLFEEVAPRVQLRSFTEWLAGADQ